MVKILFSIKNKLSTCGLIVFLMLGAAPLCSVSSAELLVLYPDVRAPFSKVFKDISSGAEEGFKGKASSEAISEKRSANKLLNRKNPDDYFFQIEQKYAYIPIYIIIIYVCAQIYMFRIFSI